MILAFIIFEGGEGVGKTTQLEKLYEKLNKQYNFSVLKTREPGGTILAEKIRAIFKEKVDFPPQPLTELYLLSAARNEHVKHVILPALDAKRIILCDRFLDSTYVYQSVLGGLEKKIVDEFSSHVLHGVIPDLTFVFYCDVSVTRQRMQKDIYRAQDRYDSADIDLHAKILDGYKKIYEDQYTYPNGVLPKRVLIDASKNIEEIFNEIFNEVKKIIHSVERI